MGRAPQREGGAEQVLDEQRQRQRDEDVDVRVGHGAPGSQMVAALHAGQRRGEEGDGGEHQQDIQHGDPPSDPFGEEQRVDQVAGHRDGEQQRDQLLPAHGRLRPPRVSRV